LLGSSFSAGQIIFERLGSLQIDIIDIALCNELVRGFCMERCGRQQQRGKSFEESRIHGFQMVVRNVQLAGVI
jgi:hypothetical protein